MHIRYLTGYHVDCEIAPAHAQQSQEALLPCPPPGKVLWKARRFTACEFWLFSSDLQDNYDCPARLRDLWTSFCCGMCCADMPVLLKSAAASSQAARDCDSTSAVASAASMKAGRSCSTCSAAALLPYLGSEDRSTHSSIEPFEKFRCKAQDSTTKQSRVFQTLNTVEETAAASRLLAALLLF